MNDRDVDLWLGRMQRRSLIVGVAGAIVFAVGALSGWRVVVQSYLPAYLFWSGVAFGFLPLLMLYNLVGGLWGKRLAPFALAGLRMIPWMVLLFLPIALSLGDLYPWADPSAVAASPAIQHKTLYLNPSFFWIRAAIYFAYWMIAAALMLRWSRGANGELAAPGAGRLLALSAPGLPIFGLTMTFASIDWAMSLDPYWFSSAFGLIFILSQILASLSLGIFVAASLPEAGTVPPEGQTQSFHDLGNLLLGFVLLWTYASFTQFLIIWSGNLPEEAPWYLERGRGLWQVLAVSVFVFSFVVPFFMLLFRPMKRAANRLALVAALVFVMRPVEMVWLVSPSLVGEGERWLWMEPAALVAVGGFWVAAYLQYLKGSIQGTPVAVPMG